MGKQSMWCEVRRHAMWESRWETYLKLCRTTWDKKWDSQLMVCAATTAAWLLPTTLLSLTTAPRRATQYVCTSKERVCSCTNSEAGADAELSFGDSVKTFAHTFLVLKCRSHLCLLHTCHRSCCTAWNPWTGAAVGQQNTKSNSLEYNDWIHWYLE